MLTAAAEVCGKGELRSDKQRKLAEPEAAPERDPAVMPHVQANTWTMRTAPGAPIKSTTFLNPFARPRCQAAAHHGVRSHAVPVALAGECSMPVV